MKLTNPLMPKNYTWSVGDRVLDIHPALPSPQYGEVVHSEEFELWIRFFGKAYITDSHADQFHISDKFLIQVKSLTRLEKAIYEIT